MVALHRDEVFSAAVKTRGAGRPADLKLDALPFNWRLISAVAVNALLWGGLVAGLRAISG